MSSNINQTITRIGEQLNSERLDMQNAFQNLSKANQVGNKEEAEMWGTAFNASVNNIKDTLIGAIKMIQNDQSPEGIKAIKEFQNALQDLTKYPDVQPTDKFNNALTAINDVQDILPH